MADPNWRDHIPTGREQFHYVFQNNLFSDVRFLVGNNQTPVYSHSFVLKVRSAVFEKQLEKLHGPVREIVIDGVKTSGFKQFIQFLYTDQIEASAEEALEVLPLAKKYRVAALASQCVVLLKENISESNAASIFQVARELKEIELEQKAIEFIQTNATQVFAAKDYTNLSIDNLCHLLKMDELDIREVNLFQAILEWGKLECPKHTLRVTPKHLRMMLKDALPLIRFPIMTLDEFKENVPGQELLNEKELKEITKYLEADLTAREFVKPISFSSVRRSLIHEESIDLSKNDEETHKRLAKLAIMKSNSGTTTSPLIVTSLIVEITPLSKSIELDELKKEIMKIRKYGLFWGSSDKVKVSNEIEKLRISFVADSRRSYGVGTVVEAIHDLENFVSQVIVLSYKDEIVVRI